jgi:integrase
MAGRPELGLDEYESITRYQLQRLPNGQLKTIPKKPGPDGKPRLAPGAKRLERWEATCLYRDPNGVRSRPKKRGPAGVDDKRGYLAEVALKALLKEIAANCRAKKTAKDNSAMRDLLERQMVAMRADPDKSRRTLDSYNRVAKVLVGEAGSCTDECIHLAGLQADEVLPSHLNDIIKDILARHDRVTAGQAKTLLSLVGEELVMSRVWPANYVNEVKFKKRSKRAQGSRSARPAGLHLNEAKELLAKLATSDAPLPPMAKAKKDHTAGRTVAQFAASVDLVDPITVALFLGVRRSELLGLLWSDYDREARTLTIQHHLIRAGAADGGEVDGGRLSELVHEKETKTESSNRVIALPELIVELLERRRGEFERKERVLAATDARGNKVPDVIFPNTVGQLRDPDTFASHWRRVRGVLGVEWLALHGFRKSTATILDELGYSPRQIADILGHHHLDETLGIYIVKGSEPHHDIAAGLNAALAG